MAGKTVVNQLQLGDNGTAANNAVWQTNADGTFELARGNAGATTQDLITVDSTGNVQLTKTTAQSMVRLNTANGYGSTNTNIRRFTTTVTNQGSDITYADSATLGASFTINTNGVYAISYTDQFTAASDMGVSLNSAQLTTSITSITVADILTSTSSIASARAGSCSFTGYLAAGAVVRPHTAGGTTGTSTNLCQFTITRVA